MFPRVRTPPRVLTHVQRRCKSTNTKPNLQELTKYCRVHGFVFPGSEIYGGFANSYDFGPLGVLMKQNISNRWWKDFVHRRPNCHGVESSILMSPKVWEASGHVNNFVDAMVECDNCHTRFRADHMLEDGGFENAGGLSLAELETELIERDLLSKCTSCGKRGTLSKPRQFNLLFQTNVGPVDDSGQVAFFRPETAQGSFINFGNVLDVRKMNLPFGIGQVGRSFRNEVSPGNFIFRTREFDQAELQFFCDPVESSTWYDYWVNECHQWLINRCGMSPESIRLRHHDDSELAHYAKATVDIEFNFPFGWSELWGIANRGDFDLKAHSEASNRKLSIRDDVTKQHVTPFSIEPALGINRLLMAILYDAICVEEKRTVLRFHPDIAPYQFSVAAIVNNQPHLKTKRDEIYGLLSEWASVNLDTSGGSVGKRYKRQDSIGTPFCVMVDSDTMDANTVTIRGRDSMEQMKLPVEDLRNPLIMEKLMEVL